MDEPVSYTQYADDRFDYLRVTLPRSTRHLLPIPMRLLTEVECQAILGVSHTQGWLHRVVYHNEPHVLFFARPRASS
jgi:hypothetical protein